MSIIDVIFDEVAHEIRLAREEARPDPWAVRITVAEVRELDGLIGAKARGTFLPNAEGTVAAFEQGILNFYGVEAILTSETPEPGTRLVWPGDLYAEEAR